mgnify:FL=1
MSDATLTGASAAPVTPKRLVPTWYAVSIGVLFGLFYAYIVWQAVASLVSAAAGPLGLNAMGWLVWIMAIVVPLIAFGAAFVVGRRRGKLGYALTMLAGLGLVAAFWLNIVAYTTLNAGSLLG